MSEPVDPKPALEAQCKATADCKVFENIYLGCAKRIEGQKDKDCAPQAMEMWTCIDKCLAKTLFSNLK